MHDDLGTVLGIASLVVTIGFAQTAAGQIARQFDAVAATQVVVDAGQDAHDRRQQRRRRPLPWDAPERVERLAGVEAARRSSGRSTLGDAADHRRARSTTRPPRSTAPPPLIAASAGLLDAVRGQVVTGRFFDAGTTSAADRVVVLGARAAERLGINRIDRQPSIFIGDIAYAVIGIVDEMQRRADLLDAVDRAHRHGAQRLRPRGCRGAAGADRAGRRAAGRREQAPIALEPEHPRELRRRRSVGAAPTCSADVQADVNVVFLVLGAIALLAGGLGIANVTLLSVMERVGEIGLRRALGATRRQIAAQFMVESVVIGLLGGLIGSSLGVLAVVVLSLSQQWTPVLDPLMAIGAALLGAVVGLAAGGLPARRAARIEPITRCAAPRPTPTSGVRPRGSPALPRRSLESSKRNESGSVGGWQRDEEQGESVEGG